MMEFWEKSICYVSSLNTGRFHPGVCNYSEFGLLVATTGSKNGWTGGE